MIQNGLASSLAAQVRQRNWIPKFLHWHKNEEVRSGQQDRDEGVHIQPVDRLSNNQMSAQETIEKASGSKGKWEQRQVGAKRKGILKESIRSFHIDTIYI